MATAYQAMQIYEIPADFWLATALAVVLALGVGQTNVRGRMVLWLFAIACGLRAIYLLIYGLAPNQPSVAFQGIFLASNVERTCFETEIKNGGSAIAYAQFIGRVQIKGFPTAPDPLEHYAADIAPYGGVITYNACVYGPVPQRLVASRAPATYTVRVDYHSKEGDEYSLCTDGAYDYVIGTLIVASDKCPSSPLVQREWLSPILKIYGVIAITWYLVFCFFGWEWRPPFWPSA